MPLSKDELELLIEELCDMSITDKRGLMKYQKLVKKLETLENNDDAGSVY